MRKVKRRNSQELGLGDAVMQLVRVLGATHATPASFIDPNLEMQKDQLVAALNTYSVDLGFECRFDPSDNLFDAAEEDQQKTPLAIIRRGAASSCCRILRSELPGSKKKRRG